MGNGASPATATSERTEPNHRAGGLNDGEYGNASSWIPLDPDAAFEIDLGRVVEVGRCKLGRDRTGEFRDRPFDRLKIEVSTNAADWKTVFAQDGITLPSQDCLIAACAQAGGAAVLTDDRHFDHIPGLEIVRPDDELSGW